MHFDFEQMVRVRFDRCRTVNGSVSAVSLLI